MIENARITHTMLGIEDHGILTAFVHLRMQGTGCGFGGFSFDHMPRGEAHPIGHAFCATFIRRVLDTVGVETWEKLPGTACRVETDGAGSGITRIGHFIEGRWFDPREVAAEMKKET